MITKEEIKMKQETRTKIENLFKEKKAQGKLTIDLIFEVMEAVERKAQVAAYKKISDACNKKVSEIDIK